MDCIKTQFVAFDEVLGIDSVIQLRGSCQANPFVIDSQSIGCRNLAEDNVISLISLVSQYSLKQVNNAVCQNNMVSLDIVIDWTVCLVSYSQVLSNISFRI